MKELLEAASNGDLAEVERLIEIGAVVNSRDEDGYTALMWAADEGRLDVVQLFVDNGG